MIYRWFYVEIKIYNSHVPVVTFMTKESIDRGKKTNLTDAAYKGEIVFHQSECIVDTTK